MTATIFVNPMTLSTQTAFWLLLPLLLGVAVVYKAVRTHNLRRLWLEVTGLMAYMIAGLTALGAALWLIQSYWP